jgi:hypothetical protein
MDERCCGLMNIQEQLQYGNQIAKRVEELIDKQVTFTWTFNGEQPIFVFNIVGNQDPDAMCALSIPALTQLVDPTKRIVWWFEFKGLLNANQQIELSTF